MKYFVYFDYLKENTWIYDTFLIFEINSKNRHYQATKRAERHIKSIIKPYDFRITKVVCE